jgi:hypothetical protein
MANAPTYDDTQAKLRQKYDGETDEEDLELELPPEIPEVNPEIYRDVEPLLFRGFLHVAAEINGVSFVFKSLNHHEFEMLSLMVPTDGTRKGLQKFYAHFLAHGVFMVDGVNVLADRDQHIAEIVRFFESSSEGANNTIIRHLSEINRRSNRAVILTEAFAIETLSRLRWAQTQGVDLTSMAVTGIQGTQSLGMNWAQLTWRAVNHYEDLREQAEREWENAKFVASAMAGKGMSRVHSQDKRRRKREREERIERRDKILRFALLGESMEKQKGAPVLVARTVEELQSQLEKDLKGEKDWHDMVVDAHEKRAREERAHRHQTLLERQKQFDVEYGPRALTGGTTRQGLTPEEVRFQVERRQQLNAQRLQAMQVHPELVDPKVADFRNKWDSTNRDPSEVAIVPTSNRPTGTPFRFNR